MAEIRPFTIDVPQSDIDDLGDRLERTRWPDAETVDGWSQGTPLAYLKGLCDYWANDYDWRRFEAEINSYPNFVTRIDGLDVHFIHVRSPHEDATPVIFTHGWPGSVVEFMAIIEPLTNPTEHGGEESDAVHVVIPSLPGYGWSERPSRAGTTPGRIATMWDELMGVLGYESYIAQGGDWGGLITTLIGAQARGRVRGIHTNMPIARPTAPGEEDPTVPIARPTVLEVAFRKRLNYFADEGSGYFGQQATRPQSLGYGLNDSPAGLAGWIVEKMWDWTDNNGLPEDGLSRHSILDNISIYWFTQTATSSARIYWESKHDTSDGGSGKVELPMAASVFRHEVLPSVRSWAEGRYLNIRYWSEVPEGGHFAAWERPVIFVDELRAAIRALAG